MFEVNHIESEEKVTQSMNYGKKFFFCSFPDRYTIDQREYTTPVCDKLTGRPPHTQKVKIAEVVNITNFFNKSST